MGGRGAQGDFVGAGGAGGFATRVTLSAEPLFRISPLPDASPLARAAWGALLAGAGDLGLSVGDLSLTEDAAMAAPMGIGSVALEAVSSACGKVTLVPSAHVRVSGAQSSSSSSMSAQLA
jgi:hypothetical protein